MKRKRIGNLTAYQLHAIKRGRLDVRLRDVSSLVLIHSIDVETISAGAAWVSYFRSGRGSREEQARLRLDTMVEVG